MLVREVLAVTLAEVGRLKARTAGCGVWAQAREQQGATELVVVAPRGVREAGKPFEQVCDGRHSGPVATGYQ